MYIPPSADSNVACENLDSVTRLQMKYPQSLLIISGDFNHASLSTVLPTLSQYVDCYTRDTKILDLLYVNVEEAYRSFPLPPLGRSDHNLVHILPVYKPVVLKQPPTIRLVKKWSEGTCDILRDCFESTDWETLTDAHGDDLDSLTSCVTDYITFCVENIVPTKKVRCYLNNKPWVTPELKMLLNEKKRAFMSGDREEQRRVQRALKRKIREGKVSYKRRIEQKLQQNNVRDVWRSMNVISGRSTLGGAQSEMSNQKWADELN